MSLRNLAENVKSCDTSLTDSIGRLISNINELIVDLILDNEFAKEKDDLITRLSWNIHLPYWFAHYDEKFDAGSMHFYVLTESVVNAGILASERLNNKELVLGSISCLYSMTEQALQKGTSPYGFDEPRILEKACYLGILALKKGWTNVFIDVALKIYEFEKKYFDKYFANIPAGIDPEKLSPSKDQLLKELLKWRDNFDYERMNGVLRIRDDAEAVMYSLVVPLDIDRFIFEVWGVITPNSELDEEIEEKNKKTKIKRIIDLLRSKIV
jgi:hypothetical protein